MKKLIIFLTLALLLAGCCSTDTQKIQDSITLIDTAAQPFYVPAIEGNTEAQMAIAAAKAAAAAGLALKDQWCPSPAAVTNAVQTMDETTKALAVSKKELVKKGLIK